MKRTTRRKRTAAEQPDRFLALHVQEARQELRKRLMRAVDALDALQVAEDELARRWRDFVLTRPTTLPVSLDASTERADRDA